MPFQLPAGRDPELLLGASGGPRWPPHQHSVVHWFFQMSAHLLAWALQSLVAGPRSRALRSREAANTLLQENRPGCCC